MGGVGKTYKIHVESLWVVLMGVDLRACIISGVYYFLRKSFQNHSPLSPQTPLRTTPQTSLLMGVDLRAFIISGVNYSPRESIQNHSPDTPQNHSPDIAPDGGGSKSLHH